MTASALLPTAILLGVYVLCAGCYGLAYTLGQLRGSRAILLSSFGFYGAQGLMTALLLLLTPLAPGWKLFLFLSFLAYAAIPPITWRHLERTHASLGHES